jgi:hypothetical protein
VTACQAQAVFLGPNLNKINNLAKLLKTKGIKILKFLAGLVDLEVTVCYH